MSKTKRQLRAEAVERLRNTRIAADGGSHEHLSDICRAVHEPEAGWTHGACEGLKAALIDLLTDDEPPEGDAVAILRKWANFWGVSHSMHTQCDSNWEVTTMHALADMIERDYVRRDEHERIVQEMVEANTRQCERTNELTAERDELKAELDAYHGKYDGMEFVVPLDKAMEFTADPPGYVKKALAELRNERDQLAADLADADRRLQLADPSRVDELTAEKRALEHELKLARGEVKSVLHNTEVARLKAERAEAEYRERMEQPVNEFWKREIELANSSRDYFKKQYERASRIALDARKVLDGRGRYALVDEEGNVVS